MSVKPQIYTCFGVGALTVWPDGTAIFKEAGILGKEYQVTQWSFDMIAGTLDVKLMPGLEYIDIEVTTVIS